LKGRKTKFIWKFFQFNYHASQIRIHIPNTDPDPQHCLYHVMPVLPDEAVSLVPDKRRNLSDFGVLGCDLKDIEPAARDKQAIHRRRSPCRAW
jgi:hypothetical protein